MEPRRARTIDELATRMSQLCSPDGLRHAQEFRASSSDVVIAPDGKSGTTFLQHVAHGVRTGGSLDFEEISCVVPWTRTAYDLGIDLTAEQPSAPRLFKSHDGPDRVPQGARYIVAFRDPVERVISSYRFLGDWVFDTDAISLDEFAMSRLPAPEDESSYWHKLVAWWTRRTELDALFLAFEQATVDVAGTVDRVAGFLGIDIPPRIRSKVIHQSSRPFMLENLSLFDEHVLMENLVARGVLPPGGRARKVTAGRPSTLQLSRHVREAYDRTWSERVQRILGFDDYESFRTALK